MGTDGSSWLDRLQRRAQQRELEPGTTPGWAFAALSAGCASAAALACVWAPWRFGVAAMACFGGHWVGFAISELLKTNKWFDVTEDVVYLGVFVWLLCSVARPSRRQAAVLVCALVWCCRLLGFLAYRIVARGSDWRFDKLITARAYNLFGWTAGGLWCFLNGFCLWILASAESAEGGGDGDIGPLAAVGLALFALGLFVETLADVQKYRWTGERRASGAEPRWIDTGLWALSRHPNYVGEMALWLGLAMACAEQALSAEGASEAVRAKWAALCFVSPLWSFAFLLFTSLMLLEKRADARWGGDPEYLAYRDGTPVLVPSLGALLGGCRRRSS